MTMRKIVAIVALVAVCVVVLASAAPRDSAPPRSPIQPRLPVEPRGGDPVAAAAAFLTAITPRVLLDRGRRDRLLDRWSDPASRDALGVTYAAEAQRVRDAFGGVPLLSRSALLGYRLERREPTSTSVAIWAVGVSAGSSGNGATGWSTITVRLRQKAASWRVVAVVANPGPDPIEPAAQLVRDAAGFRPFRHAR